MAEGAMRVSLIGSGCWGSAIARIVGHNVLANPDRFEQEVLMYVYEEMHDGRQLTEIINTDHENTKYLPDIKLPNNVIALPDVVKACRAADILIFVLPHQFVAETCSKMKPAIKPSAIGVSLIKGFILPEPSGIQLVSQVITKQLDIPVATLMGANLATEVASELFCETTVASPDPIYDLPLRRLFETQYFRVRITRCVAGMEVCAALKNVIGIAAGVVDGLGYGDNTKAAVIRLGLMEMRAFCTLYLDTLKLPALPDNCIFFESCGISDLVATCHGGRNRLLGEALVKSAKKKGAGGGTDIRTLEKEILRGQSFQGPLIAKEIYTFVNEMNRRHQFPLLIAIHKICTRELEPRAFIDALKEHPEHQPKHVPLPSIQP